jgi:uncharacterized membrane protein YhaH (DUF805 family)
MDLQALYLSSDGRISRKTWWIGTIILIVATLVLYFILGLVGLGLTSRWGPIIAYLIVIVPTLNLGVKRRHDRDNNGNDYRILIGLYAVLTLLQVLGIGYTVTDLGNGMVAMVPDMWMSVITIVVSLYGLYLLIQMGFLKGTPGTNTYGADPLGYAVAA